MPTAADATAAQPTAAAPTDDSARVSEPVDSVMWRTSIGRPKNFANTGIMPSRKPSATEPPKPAASRSRNRARRAMRARPTRRPMRWCSIASGSRR